MRVSRAVMAENHSAIVASAAKMLRLRGIDGMSVAELMESVGLTHGGFYRHFASKDELVAAAIVVTFDGIFDRLTAKTAEGTARAALELYTSEYLTERHYSNPEIGCPVAAYGAEVARCSPVVRDAFGAGVGLQISWVAQHLKGSSERRRANATEIVSALVGTMVLARSSPEMDQARHILAAGRHRVKLLLDEYS